MIFTAITIHMNHAHHFGISNAYTMYNKTMTESIYTYPPFYFSKIFGLYAQIRADCLLWMGDVKKCFYESQRLFSVCCLLFRFLEAQVELLHRLVYKK